jgi:hypothetical protein
MSELLNRRIGPFTLGVWAIIVAAGLALGLAARRLQGGLSGNLPPIDAETTETPAQAPVFATQGAATFYPMNGGGGYGGEAETPEDNNAWVKYATRILVARGLFDAGALDTALRKYVQGEVLTVAEAAIVSTVIREIGPAPEPVPPMRTEASPTTPVPSAAPRFDTRQTAYLATLAQVFATIKNREAQGQNYADQFPRLQYLGARSSSPELSPSAQGWYRTYLQTAQPSLIR